MTEGKILWEVNDEGFLFKYGGVTGALPEWNDPTLAPGDSYALQVLESLVHEGSGQYTEGAVLVPHRVVAGLDEEERVALGLPEPFPFDLEIKASGSLTDADFRYNIFFLNGRERPFVNPSRCGAYLKVTEELEYILHGDIYHLVESIESFNARSSAIPRNSAERLLCFAEIAGLARSVGAALDHYLNSQKVIVPEKITIRLRRMPDNTLEVDPVFCETVKDDEGRPEQKPLLSSEEEEDFLRKFDARRVMDIYTSKDGTRIVLREKQKQALNQIKACRRLAGREKEKFLQAPQEFLDPDLIHIEDFSERVNEIGEYKQRYLPFLSITSESWFPEGSANGNICSGIIVIESSGEQRRITIRPEEITSFKNSVQEAIASGKSEINWEGKLLKVSEELEYSINKLDTAHKILSGLPEGTALNRRTLSRHILIIKENFEVIDYSPDEYLRSGDIGKLSKYLKPEVNLLEYQYEGYKWLQEAWVQGRRGALLADDMGLGKTLQALAFMAWVREQMEAGHVEDCPMLVVTPQVLLKNWEEEYLRFLNPAVFGMPLILHGSELRRFRMQPSGYGNLTAVQYQKLLDVETIKKRKLVITTYETVRDFQLSLGKIEWGVMVLDEAQKIKNPTTLVAMAAKAMKYDFGLCLTGTPVENSWIDLWSVLDFAVPGTLEPLNQFINKYHYPLKKPGADIEALGYQLKRKVDPFIMRRLKEEKLKGLPEKKVIQYRVPMTERQARMYNECLNQAWQSYGNLQCPKKGGILKTINLLYEISLHPDLPVLSNVNISSTAVENFISSSAKLIKTFEILDDVQQAGEKAIIFLRNKKLQRCLQLAIYKRYGIEVSIINGEVLGETRKHMVDRFQKKPGFNVIIMSPDAAGIGLNIVAANHVIHLSRPWNPAKEDQATDRVYRLGQNKTVYVHIPLAVHPAFEGASFDEKLDSLLAKKRRLSCTVLLPPEVSEEEKLSFAKEIFSYGSAAAGVGTAIDVSEVDQIPPTLFEACVAAIFRKMGYEVSMTPVFDRGADIVVLPKQEKGDRGILIQCKQARHPSDLIGPGAVREIMAARSVYESLHGCMFNLAVVTNASGFTESAVEVANANGVELVARGTLADWLTAHPVECSEILFSTYNDSGYSETEVLWN